MLECQPIEGPRWIPGNILKSGGRGNEPLEPEARFDCIHRGGGRNRVCGLPDLRGADHDSSKKVTTPAKAAAVKPVAKATSATTAATQKTQTAATAVTPASSQTVITTSAQTVVTPSSHTVAAPLSQTGLMPSTAGTAAGTSYPASGMSSAGTSSN